MTAKAILEVKGLRTSFMTEYGEIPAVDGISFQVREGEILGIVGESGCGKSVTSLSIMGLVPQPPGKIVAGEILLEANGKPVNLIKLPERRMRKIRGSEIAMIFQEPMTSLNPVYTIGNQLIEMIRIHRRVKKREAYTQAMEVLKEVGIPRVAEIMREYPHQLSGGMRQRVMIAMAMSCHPKLLIADEPTTALDVTIQAQILELMKKLNHEHRTAIMFITHDLGVVAETCDRVLVMYGGKIVEEGLVRDIVKNPQHPYTRGLIKSIPQLNQKETRLYSIPGNVPKPGSFSKGCRFAPRCAEAMPSCKLEEPALIYLSDTHASRCLLHEEKGGIHVG